MIVHGTKNVDLFECTNPQLNKWRVRWNIQPDNDQNNEKINEDLVIYNEVEFSYKPSIEEIKELIFDWYNQIIDNKILSKSEIISYLDFFINQRSSLWNMTNAISKWEADREFVENYKIGQFMQHGVKAIYRN